MDDQQPSFSAFEFGWLCGIIDGEGCIGLWSRGGKRKHEFKPGLRLANTDKKVIDTVCWMFDRMGVGYHVTHYKPRKDSQKEYWNITVEGFKRLSKLLPHIKDVLQSKREQAQLVHKWVESRSSKWHRSEYTEEELEIPKRVYELNYRGKQK